MSETQAEAVTLADLIAQHSITASSRWDDNAVDRDVDPASDWAPGTSHYLVTLRMGRKRLTVPFHMGSAHTSEPTAAEVLDCLVSDANSPEDFAEFCSDFGFDVDSRKAEKTHKACLAIGRKLRQFLGEHFDAFQAAERL